MVLSDPVTTLKGVGAVRQQQLEKLGIFTLQDLICYFPRTYEDRTKLLPLNQLSVGQSACFEATVTSTPRTSYVKRNLIYTKCTISDNTTKLRVTWFNQPWMSDNLKAGETYCFYGMLSGDDRRCELQNPIVERLDTPPTVTRCIIPVYALTKGLSSKMLQQIIRQALTACQNELTEFLPEKVRLQEQFLSIQETYQELHWPTTLDALNKARARVVFEEFFIYALGLGLMKSRRTETAYYPCAKPIPDIFYDVLPFSLTNAQRRVLQEISQDMCSGKTMNRLVQGDVGSGKTMVALGAIMQAVENGYQAALMAPTELLAAQHYQTLTKLLEPLGIRCILLTGSTPTAQRRRYLDYMAVGAANVVIGTHALFSDTTQFNNLGLVIIDEQHRFGVRQRAALAAKGNAPHVLVLSATPIPRTLALILYGDLSLSVIDELPPGRQPVDTFLVTSGYRARLNGFIKKHVSEGHQVYVVCPAVEENEDTGLTSAETMYETLSETFPSMTVGLVHGKLTAAAKEASMADFLYGKSQILVATTVIEVGVDVKNATLMVVEDADRFGLSQLHQLRGRVGRNSEKSYCILVSDNKNQETRKRLKALCTTNDGFEIAQQDLKLRGPGDFFGQRQSGLPAFHMASLSADLGILTRAQEAAQGFLSTHPDLTDPVNKVLLQQVHRLFERAEDTFN